MGAAILKSLKDDSGVKYDPETARAIRLHLERLACKIERAPCNNMYSQIFSRIARLIRESKPD
jgi:hypothetical protein